MTPKIFSSFLLVNSKNNIKGKSFPNLHKKNNTYLLNIEKNQTNQRKLDEYDTYFIIYYKKDVNYPSDFNNTYREKINFIINTEDNTQLCKEEPLKINKAYGIEIHFGEKITIYIIYFLPFMMKT